MATKNSTGSLTPSQMRERADALTEQAKRLEEQSQQMELSESTTPASEKSVSASKTIINISYIVFGVVGIIGSFWDKFDMAKYVQFLQTFAYLWAPLVISVGAGRALKNYVTQKYGNNSSVDSSSGA